MSATDRQNRLLLAEDWKKVYQSFRNADFQSYDFDNLRRSMIQYLRQNYPEDFNDYIESSEYLALIDLIAFLGQNLAFRVDLNARENFLELADRRESVLRLARTLAYNPSRNKSANGFLKIDSVSTTESLVDSNGINLARQTILWNDPSNSNWSEQFTKVLNSALPVNGIIGRPNKSESINGVLTQQYRFNATNRGLPKYSFSKPVNGSNTQFEVVSSTIKDGNIYEEPPLPGNSMAFLYREDGRGNGSANTGYFMHFRQGLTQTGEFSITNPSANQVVNIDTTNINNDDVWLYTLNSLGIENTLWSKVDSAIGNNVIYNSTEKNVRNIYAVQTRIEDRINLLFSDGVFGNLPRGNFRIYYRTSANRQFVIRPGDISNVIVTIDYLSRNNSIQTLTLSLSLKDTVDNASVSETTANIKRKAPQTYYSQNRMITGEDYQVIPLNASQEIIKVKSVNRTSSGISRYFDLKDPTSKYSSTNLFGKDGIVYKENITNKYSFTFTTQTDIEGQIANLIEPLLSNRNINNFYHANYARIIVSDLNAEFEQTTSATNSSTGFLQTNQERFLLGSFTGGALKYIEPGALLKFVPPASGYFDSTNDYAIRSGTGQGIQGAVDYKWVRVISVNDNGTVLTADGKGAIALNEVIPEGAFLEEVRPKYTRLLPSDVKTQIIDQIFAYKTFGLRYDQTLRQWRVILKENLNSTGEFSNGKAGDTTRANLDASWILLFETDGEKYTINTRGLRYVFESDEEINFYFDAQKKIYDNRTGQLIKDKINVLSINTQPNSTLPFNTDIVWEIVSEFTDVDGYINSKKVEVGFYDQNDDGVIDDPDIFENLVPEDKIIFLKKINSGVDSEIFVYDSNTVVKTVNTETEIDPNNPDNVSGDVFYIIDVDVFKTLGDSGVLTINADYKAFNGQNNIKFQYVHSADENNRIDPGATNIIDTYILTRQYDINFRKYLAGAISDAPLPPSSDNIYLSYGQEINKYKATSDEVIYHPVKYKVLFGQKAEERLQAVFKVVKNPEQVVNDNDIKSRIIAAINQFFALDNWNFGEAFNFSELATFVMNSVAPDIVNFIIVPAQEEQTFGSMYEIKSEANEIFISGATVDNIEVIDAITASRINAGSGTFVSATQTVNTGIQSGGSN